MTDIRPGVLQWTIVLGNRECLCTWGDCCGDEDAKVDVQQILEG